MSVNNNTASKVGDSNGAKVTKLSSRNKGFEEALNNTLENANTHFAKPSGGISNGKELNLTYKELIEKFKIDLSHPLQPPPICLEIIGKNENAALAHYGGVTLVTAKAKNGKTFFITLLISALISGTPLQNTIIPHFVEGKKIIQWFDTEQSSYHVQKLGKRLEVLSGITNPSNLQLLKLRTEPNHIKKKIIETIIYNTPGLAVVVIDGGRDLINDINSSEEATNESSDLLKWAEDLNICIIVVLHQNKNDNNARGHYGTELKNKSEFIVNVTKDKENGCFIVEAEDCRDKEFDPFAFKINEDGVPYILSEWDNETKTERKPELLPHQVDDAQHHKILCAIFSKLKPKYDDLVNAIKNEFEQFGGKFGVSKAKQFKIYYEQKGWIETYKESGNRYPLYRYTQSV